MKILFKCQSLTAMVLMGFLMSTNANAAPPTTITGNWAFYSNQSPATLQLSQGSDSSQCKPIVGYMIYNNSNNYNYLRGFYCPATGRIAFYRLNDASVSSTMIQAYQGNVSDTGTPTRMTGTFQALNPSAGSGALSESPFYGWK